MVALHHDSRAHVYASGIDRNAHADVNELLDLLQRPAWMADALCREHPEVRFFPERGEPTAPAKAICRDCLVRQECEAFGRDEAHGIWGGLSNRERRRLRGQRLAS